MMPRVYSVEFENQGLTAAGGDYDLFRLTQTSILPVYKVALVGLVLAVTSELGDVEEEWLRISIQAGTSGASITGGTTTTPRPLDEFDTAADTEAKVIDSAAPAITGQTLLATAVNVRKRFSMWWPRGLAPQQILRNNASGRMMSVKMTTTVADTLTMSGTLYFIEDGS